MRKNVLWTLAAAVLVSFAGCRPSEVGMIAVYEVDADKRPSGAKLTDAEMQRLLTAIDRRINPRGHKSGRVRQLDDERIEVSIFRARVDKMQRFADLLPRPGTLEFRILANDLDHKSLIEDARQTDANTLYALDAEGKRELGEDGKPILRGWWVPVTPGKESSFPYSEIATRTEIRDGEEITEILVVKDLFDVDGGYVVRASRSVDQRGRPSVDFVFDTQGGQLFLGLTSSNLPDEMPEFTRKLGIVLGGYLHSAPAIQSQISNRGEISGDFTEQEVKDLVDVLNAGSLPTAIRKVEQRLVDIEK